jgi:hypothetical protein
MGFGGGGERELRGKESRNPYFHVGKGAEGFTVQCVASSEHLYSAIPLSFFLAQVGVEGGWGSSRG